jgi:hypothetical protein
MNPTRVLLGIVKSYRHGFCPSYQSAKPCLARNSVLGTRWGTHPGRRGSNPLPGASHCASGGTPLAPASGCRWLVLSFLMVPGRGHTPSKKSHHDAPEGFLAEGNRFAPAIQCRLLAVNVAHSAPGELFISLQGRTGLPDHPAFGTPLQRRSPRGMQAPAPPAS